MNGTSLRISIETRMELNAIVDALAADGETFSADLARRLIALLPITPRPSAMQAEASWTSAGQATEALTTTGHLAAADSREGKGGFSLGSDGTFRVGQWKLGHRPGCVVIGQVMDVGIEPKSCRLRYVPGTGAPIDMQWPRFARFSIGRFGLVVMTGWRDWKRPVSLGEAE